MRQWSVGRQPAPARLARPQPARAVPAGRRKPSECLRHHPARHVPPGHDGDVPPALATRSHAPGPRGRTASRTRRSRTSAVPGSGSRRRKTSSCGNSGSCGAKCAATCTVRRSRRPCSQARATRYASWRLSVPNSLSISAIHALALAMLRSRLSTPVNAMTISSQPRHGTSHGHHPPMRAACPLAALTPPRGPSAYLWANPHFSSPPQRLCSPKGRSTAVSGQRPVPGPDPAGNRPAPAPATCQAG